MIKQHLRLKPGKTRDAHREANERLKHDDEDPFHRGIAPQILLRNSTELSGAFHFIKKLTSKLVDYLQSEYYIITASTLRKLFCL